MKKSEALSKLKMIRIREFKHAAKKYIDREYPNKEPDGSIDFNAVDEDISDAFVQGCLYRDREIEALGDEIERLQKDIAEGLKREEIARRVIEEKRDEIDRLKAEAEDYEWKH